MQLKEAILKQLQKEEGFVSGQTASEMLGVSRTAVWKAIRQLTEDGYTIEAVRNKGYRLLSQPDILSADRISQSLNTVWTGGKIFLFKEIDSTNNEAKRLAEAGAPHGSLLVTEMQSAGRGRRGRGWTSPKGAGVFFTLILRPQIAPWQASMLTLVMALAVRRAIHQITGITSGIKWPNDVVISGKKVCGILTEMSAEPDQIQYIVTGAGINLTKDAYDAGIKDTAVSLEEAGAAVPKRSSLIAAVMNAYEELYDAFIAAGDLTPLIKEYNSALIHRDKPVMILDPKGAYEAVAKGADANGCLHVMVKGEETERVIMSGEISVRGVHGYV